MMKFYLINKGTTNKGIKNKSYIKKNTIDNNIKKLKYINEINLEEEEKIKGEEIKKIDNEISKKSKKQDEQKEKYILKELEVLFRKEQQSQNKYCRNINYETGLVNKIIYSIIPLNIFYFWYSNDLPVEIKKNYDFLKLQNPEFNHYLYDIQMSRDFLKKNFDNNILYAFDKFVSYKYKMYLWCFCILYKYGGIFMNVSYISNSNFVFLELTDKEYYCSEFDNNNINLDLIVCLPNNPIMNKCINQIVLNCKNSFYGSNELEIVNNQIKTCIFHEKINYNNLSLINNGNVIKLNNSDVLYKNIYYRNYNFELWNKVEIYNYPILKYKNRIDYSNTIDKIIFDEEYKFYSGSPTIVSCPHNVNHYIINIRYINYMFVKTQTNDKEITKTPNHWITLNIMFKVDENFKKITEDILLDDINIYNEETYKSMTYKGFEDLRLFLFLDKLYYVSTTFDRKTQKMLISSNNFVFNKKKYTLNKNIIYPSFLNEYTTEKNWSFFDYKNELSIVYKWFPLQIGKINYVSNELKIIDIKYNIPDYFKDAKGSTCGFKTIENELWFVLHKSQHKGNFVNYQHFFAVFDSNMNLLRYSELFKFENYKVEFCMGLVIRKNKKSCKSEIILSYSLMDTQSILCVYDMEYINNELKWYKNENL